jgi:AraC-like DNA-binding protein
VLDTESCALFHAAFSSVVLFAYGNFSHHIADEVMRLAQVGVHGVAICDMDDGHAMLPNLLKRALDNGFEDRVLTMLEDGIAADLLPLFKYLLEHTTELITPQNAARVAFCHTKTLRERLHRSGLPPTAQLIAWTRLFHAAHLLEDAARSVENVAGLLDFPSAAALGNQIKRYVGLSPAALRRSGGLQVLVKAFMLQMHVKVAPVFTRTNSVAPTGSRSLE